MAGQPVIVVQDLTKTYADGTAALKGISFTVGRGEIFGFLGPNGAGKTTAMRILGTLHKASAGRASVLGHDVDRDSAEVQRRIGFAMQEVGMDDLATAREMLVLHCKLYGLSARQAKERAEELLATFDLAPHADRRVTRFSGGMQRRLDLAVSLVHTPEVLFLDEPSTGLDPKSRADLWAVLRKLRAEKGITILMSTHYMDEADALCDRIAIINKGRIAAIDTPANLKRGVGADQLRLTLSSAPTAQQWSELQRVFGPANVVRDAVAPGPGAAMPRAGTATQGGGPSAAPGAGATAIALRVRDGARALMPALQIVTDLGLAVTETKVQSPTLEDVFLKYTGASLSEHGSSAPAADPRDARAKKGKGPAHRKISDERVEPEVRA